MRENWLVAGLFAGGLFTGTAPHAAAAERLAAPLNRRRCWKCSGCKRFWQGRLGLFTGTAPQARRCWKCSGCKKLLAGAAVLA